MRAETLFSIESLSVSIGARPIIRNLSLQVGAGEILGLVGASGSGKSMTALAIMQLLPPQARVSGSVQLGSEELTCKSESELQSIRGRAIGMVFQEPMTALNPLMRIGEQVAETVRVHRAAGSSRALAIARATLESVGLTGAMDAGQRYPHELSGGQRQRVAIAMAVVMKPLLLIADEPTTALDVGTQAQVLQLLRGLARGGMGVILVSHDLAVIAQVTDRIAVLHEGEIVERGATNDVLRDLRHPYSRALLTAAMPQPMRRARPHPAAPVVLQVNGIVREYSRRRRSLLHAAPPFRAVDGATLCVHAGETVALVGESGSGKSSLLRAILALEPPQAGDVVLLGESLTRAKGPVRRRLRRSIQAVFQDPYGSFDPLWPVERVIAEPFFLLDTPPTARERRNRVVEALEQVGLAAADAPRYAREFSGGQRQRIAIARALITAPAMIALDEAVSALDVIVRAQILALLAGLADRLKLAYLFVSHDLNMVRSIADRVYVMQHGRIVEQGAAASVFAAPQHPHTRALIAAAPRLAAPPSAAPPQLAAPHFAAPPHPGVR